MDLVTMGVTVVVAFLSGGLGHILGAKSLNRFHSSGAQLNTARAAEAVAGGALAIIEKYEDRIFQLEQRVAELEFRIAELEARAKER